MRSLIITCFLGLVTVVDAGSAFAEIVPFQPIDGTLKGCEDLKELWNDRSLTNSLLCVKNGGTIEACKQQKAVEDYVNQVKYDNCIKKIKQKQQPRWKAPL